MSIVRESERVALRPLAADDEAEFTELARASTDLHRPWIFAPTTSDEFKSYIKRFDRQAAESMLVCDRGSGAIAGFINITEIIRGPYQRATVGYGVFAPYARQGYMSEGLGLVVQFAFAELGLHRLEADIQPGNKASFKLAGRAGFRYEGYSPAFVRIGEQWKDHERWAINADMVVAVSRCRIDGVATENSARSTVMASSDQTARSTP